MDKLLAAIDDLGVKGVELLALVSDTSYDVVFYANVDGKKIQSNSLAENGAIELSRLADFYGKVAEIVRGDPTYDASALNVVSVDAQKHVSINKEAIDCRVYAIKKNWRAQVLGS